MALSRLIRVAKRVLMLGLCVGLAAAWAAYIRVSVHTGTRANDFMNMFYGTRCFLEHKDLYNPGVVREDIREDGGPLPELTAKEKAVSGKWVTMQEYLPPAYLAMAPFALLPRTIAESLWMAMVPLLMILAGYMAWDLAPGATVMAGCMAGFILLSSVVLLTLGNPAGLVLPFCVVSAWCFLKERFAPAGVALLAWSLAVKPHDAGLIWLFFLLAGGSGRKRALQTLGVTVALGICAVIWIAPASPHWIEELHNGMVMASARGSATDPGPTGLNNRTFNPIISLQNGLSVFEDDPHFYNSASYAIGGGLILIWVVAVLRKRPSRENSLLALAAISILTMLPVYHHAEDAKLLLLVIPGCAVLWRSGGARRWIALGLTWAAICATGDLAIVAIVMATGRMQISTSTLTGKLMLLMVQPAPLVLLVAGCFYLNTYLWHSPQALEIRGIEDTAMRTAAGAAAR